MCIWFVVNYDYDAACPNEVELIKDRRACWELFAARSELLTPAGQKW